MTIDFFFKIFVWQWESRAQRTNVKSHCPNVNSKTAKCTLPRKLGSVYLAVSSLTLGWNCTRCTCSQVLLSLGSASALENLTGKCTSCNFNSSPAKSNFKSALSRCAWLGRLENGLSRTWARVCEIALPPQCQFFFNVVIIKYCQTTFFSMIFLNLVCLKDCPQKKIQTKNYIYRTSYVYLWLK